jgi:hypothetical protein
LAPAPKSHTFAVTIRVTDASGAELPNASVLIAPLTVDSTTLPASASFNASQRGTITAELKPGTYAVSVSAPGFKSWHQQVRLDKSLSLAITLQIPNYSGPIRVMPIDNPALVPKSTTLQELIPETAK